VAYNKPESCTNDQTIKIMTNKLKQIFSFPLFSMLGELVAAKKKNSKKAITPQPLI